jgi:eukaryotic-like serine/threonine-protein kinase
MQYGRYRIVKELGKGSMGVVYQAHDPQIDRSVALKVLRPDRVTSETFRHRFLKEARAVGRLSHPNIVVVFDIGEDHGTVYISMEFLEGRPLSDLVQEERFTEAEALEVGIQVADALDYAHRKGIVHRDIKPSNIIIQPDGQVKITDFGIAHIDDPEATTQTQAGEILGTPAYMSPEQVLGQPVDGRSDLFSLGVILYELCVGHRPFRGETLATIFRAITNEDPVEPVRENSTVSSPLSQTIMKCLAKGPEQRFPSGKELTDALRTCQRGPETIQTTGTDAQARRQAPTSPLVWIAFTLLLVVGGTAGFYVIKKAFPPNHVQDTNTNRTTGTKDGLKSLDGSRPADTKGVSDRAADTVKKTDPTATNGDKKASTGDASSGDKTAPPDPNKRATGSDARGPFGSLRLESKPLGAQVLVDGEVKGLTPIEIKLPPGSHEVRLSMENHGDWEAQVRISENKVTVIPVELVRMP